MPDWCRSRVAIEGPEEAIEECAALIGDDFDFNRIIPTPAKLRDTGCGGRSFPGTGYVHVWAEDPGYPNGVRYLSDLEEDELREKYGCTDWYEWAVKNWGVQWGASAVSVELGEEYIHLEFATPWGPPVPVIEELRELFEGELDIYAYAQTEEPY